MNNMRENISIWKRFSYTSTTRKICIALNLLFLLTVVSCSTIPKITPTDKVITPSPPLVEKKSTATEVSSIHDKLTPTTKSLPSTETPVGTNTPQPSLAVISGYPQSEIFHDRHVYPYVSLVSSEQNELILFSPLEMSVKRVSFGDDWTVLRVNKFQQQCNLLLTTRTQNEIRLVTFDLRNQQTIEVFVGKNIADETWQTWPTISPTGEWLAYAVWSGNFTFNGAEFQDVEIVPVGKNQPVRLTSRGGAWNKGGVWSPKEDFIAFTDFDESGISQGYIVDVKQGTRLFSTEFEEPGYRIGSMVWSPQGDKIAFVVLNNSPDGTPKVAIWVADLQSKGIRRINLPVEINTVGENIYWDESGEKIVLSGTTSEERQRIYWFDLKDNKIVHSLGSNELSKADPSVETFSFLFPVTKDLSVIGFLSMNEIYLYDSTTATIFLLDDYSIGLDWPAQEIIPIDENVDQCFE